MEQVITKCLTGSDEPVKDVVHSFSELLPKGEKPWTKEEEEYIYNRLWEESLKLTDWIPVNCG